MYIIDTHCDVLYQLQKNSSLSFQTARKLQANCSRLRDGNVKLQFFAIFLDPEVPIEKRWEKTLEQIDIFKRLVANEANNLFHVTDWQQIEQIPSEKIGAILSLEGAESFGKNVQKLEKLYEAGVLSIGLTWNYGNDCGNGVLAKSRSGLTELGFTVVLKNNERKVLTDVAHINERGFWDIIETATYPFCSHGNCYTICPHPRNLTDEQLRALIARKSPIHLAFYPPFITNTNRAQITDLIRHIEHICSLGGENQVGFGSDFDGIDFVIDGLEHAGKYGRLVETLLKYYPERLVKKFCYGNFSRYVKTTVLINHS